MRGFTMPWLESLFLLIVTAVRVTSRVCPNNIEQSTHECLSHYSSLISAQQMSGLTFFEGIDVETIRAICHSLRSSMRCVYHFRQKCPPSVEAEIDRMLSDVRAMSDLCMLNNLYERYAQHQSCYQKIAANSQHCYTTYRSHANPLMDAVYQEDYQALKDMCMHYTTLVECVEAHAQSSCDNEAAELAEYLISPSVPMSPKCRELLDTTTQPPITQGPRRAEIGQEAPSGGNGAHRFIARMDISLVLCALVAVVYNYKPSLVNS